MKKIYLGIALLITIFSCEVNEEKGSNSAYDENAAQTQTFFHTEGKKLIDPSGNEIKLKGTNIGNWLVPEGYMFKMKEVNSPRKINELLYELVGPDSLVKFWDDYLTHYITREDVKYLKQIGCNHVRLPFHYALFTDEMYMGKRNAGFTYLDKFMEWCRQENVYVLLDMHCAPGGQTGDNIDDSFGYPYLFKSASSQQQFVDIWRKIAEKYKDDPIVIGYDLVNEPIAHYFDKEHHELASSLANLYKTTITEIRKVDTNHTIFLNGSIWASQFGLFDSLIYPNTVYEFHKYWVDVHKGEIQAYLDFRDKYNVPIYVGETGENKDEWIYDFRILLEENDVNWAYWPYKKMNNTAGIMNFKEPEEYKLITKYAESDRGSYAKVRENIPDRNTAQQALNAFIENSKFKNCYPNKGYCEGLGLKCK